MPHNELSAEAVRVLRDTVLDLFSGQSFIRCGKNLGMDGAAAVAGEIRRYTEDSEDSVHAAFNQETGHNDYVRVNRDSAAYRLVCRMKA